MTKSKIFLAALGVWLLAVCPLPSSDLLSAAIPCGAVTPCPTNFATVGGLNTSARMVAAGGTSVWALDNNFAIYRYDAGTHRFLQMPGSLVYMTVGGGDLLRGDEVWGYNAYGQYWRWTAQGWINVPTPSGSLGGLAIGKGYNDSCHNYEVWGLDSGHKIWRYNYCTASWNQVPGLLTRVAVGNGEIWGINSAGQIWRFNNTTQNSWTQIPGILASIAVGADGVWGINSSGQVFQFNAASQTFLQITNASLTFIAAGGNGVWGINSSLQVYRYQAIPRTFANSPSVSLRQLSVGTGGGVWGIDNSGNVRVFVTPPVQPGAAL